MQIYKMGHGQVIKHQTFGAFHGKMNFIYIYEFLIIL